MPQSSPHNILFVSNYPSDTGYAWWLMEHYWIVLAEHCCSIGGKAFAAYPRITSISDHLAGSPIKPIELEVPSRWSRQTLRATRFLREHSISYIYFTDRPYVSLQYATYRLSGVERIIVHDHTPGDRPVVTGLKGVVKSWRHQIPLTSADYVFCVSELMRQRSILNARFPAERCITIQNGINPVDRGSVCRSAVRQALDISPESIVIVTTGRAHPYKRLDFIVDCAAELRREHPELDVVFLIVGDGPIMSELKSKVHRLRLQHSVRLLGFRTDARDILCASDIAFHAARGEGFSLSIVEYMSAGLPVLVPDIPSVSQAIDHNTTGLTYASGDCSSAVGSIISLAINQARREQLGRQAKEVADNQYTLESSTLHLKQAARMCLPTS